MVETNNCTQEQKVTYPPWASQPRRPPSCVLHAFESVELLLSKWSEYVHGAVVNKVLEPNQAVPIPSQFVSLCVVPCPCPCLRSCRRVRSGRRVEGRCGDIAPVRGKCEPFITGWSKRTTAHRSRKSPWASQPRGPPRKHCVLHSSGNLSLIICPHHIGGGLAAGDGGLVLV